MAQGQGSQYIELPDSTPENPSYGEFPADAADADIHRQITIAYPDQFNQLSKGMPTIMRRSDKGNLPPAGRVPPVNMHKSYMIGDPNDDPESDSNSMLGIAKGMIKGPVNDAVTMTRAGYQSAAKGLMRNKSAPLGEPPSMAEFKPAAMNTAIAMMGGVGEESVTAGSGASSKLIRQAESAPPPTSTPGAYGRSSGRTGTSVGGGAGTASGIASDIGDLMQPKWMKAIKLIKKHASAIGSDETGGEVNANPNPNAAPLPHPLAGKGVFGTPVSEWGSRVQPPRSATPRPEPAWKSAKADDNFEWPDNYRGGAKTLTKNDNGGANYSAEDLAALKQKHGISTNSPVSQASTKLVKAPKVNGDVIGERTAEPRTPGEPLQHGFNPKPAEDLGLKVRSTVERRQGPLPRGGNGDLTTSQGRDKIVGGGADAVTKLKKSAPSGQDAVERLYQKTMDKRDASPNQPDDATEDAYTEAYLDAHKRGDIEGFKAHTSKYLDAIKPKLKKR